jgi:hypothetical protein
MKLDGPLTAPVTYEYIPSLVVFISMWNAKFHICINYEAILIILYRNKDKEKKQNGRGKKLLKIFFFVLRNVHGAYKLS